MSTEAEPEVEKAIIEIEDSITVGDLADKLTIPATKLIGELFKNGVMVTVNERIDFDTAEIIVGELGLEIELARKPQEEKMSQHRAKREVSDKAGDRPPVVAVMGHVDHGKTSLLDAIRSSEVTKGEAGGITQHISAYQVEHNKRIITFLDTPGHEAFAALREHGAALTDVVIIVVAADDGVKPQTLEAIRFAQKAGVKIVVAINKIDKEGADLNRVKQQLAENNLQTEEWGGDTVTVAVSAKSKEGIDTLLDMVLLVADVEELKADTDVPATGLVIEAHMEQGRGPIAVVLVESGELKAGQFVVAGSTYAKVRNLETMQKQPMKLAGPSTPAVVTGFKKLPEFGDEFQVVKSEKEARALTEQLARDNKSESNLGVDTSNELMRMINRNMTVQEMPIVIKADVKGSLTSVIDSLKTLDNEEVAVRIVSSGVGDVNENDLHLAHTSGARIYGFNVGMPSTVKQHASRDKISIKLFSVIYELIDDAKEALTGLLAPEIVETSLGRLIIKGVFKTTKNDIICGGEVTKGKLSMPALVRITRGDEVLAEAELVALKKGPQDVKEAVEGDMCGIQLKTATKVVVEEGDRVELFTRETVARKL